MADWPGAPFVAVRQFGTLPVDRLLDVVDHPDPATLRTVRRVVHELTS